MRNALDGSRAIGAVAAIVLAACSGAPKRAPAPETERTAVQSSRSTACAMPAAAQRRGGGYYLDDGPGENAPANLDEIPDAVPRLEPIRPANVRPYEALGRTYRPLTQLAPYKERGAASWYGRRYHGQKTASGEVYDMYAMTAAHTVLPIPSYARVTNLRNGRSIVVRINDRGPFHADRIIDLSYTAACKLDVLAGGSTPVEVEAIVPDDTAAIAAAPKPTPAPAEPAAIPAVVAPSSPPPAVDGVALPAAAAETPASAMPVTTERSGYYLQLGAFGSRDSADNFLGRMKAQADWLAQALHVYARDGLFRVHAGPYANRAEARAAADRLGQSLGIKAMVLSR